MVYVYKKQLYSLPQHSYWTLFTAIACHIEFFCHLFFVFFCWQPFELTLWFWFGAASMTILLLSPESGIVIHRERSFPHSDPPRSLLRVQHGHVCLPDKAEVKHGKAGLWLANADTNGRLPSSGLFMAGKSRCCYTWLKTVLTQMRTTLFS